MALIASEGFGWSNNVNDYYTIGQWSTSQFANISSNGPLGDNYAVINYASTGVFNLPVLLNSFYFGARFNGNANGFNLSFNTSIAPSGGFPVNFLIRFTGTGVLLVYRDNGSSLLGSVATSAPGNGWFYMEVFVTVSTTTSSSDGVITVKINGVTALSFTGINNNNGAAGSSNISSIGCAALGGQVYMTHVYMCDTTGTTPWNTFLGDVRVQTLLPVANATVGFTPNGTNTNWQNVSTVPPNGNVDYNYSNTTGTQDTFDMSPMSNTLGTIYGVNVKTIANKTNAGIREIAAVVVSGGVQANSANVSLSTSFKQYQTVFETDPNTLEQWTQTGVNSANIGYLITL